MDKFGKNESESIRPGEALGVGGRVLQKRDTVTANTYCRSPECYDSQHNDTQYYRTDI